MANDTQKPAAVWKSNSPSKARSVLALKLSALLLVGALAGCQTTQTGVPTVGTVSIQSVQCWPKRITYSKKDTKPTKDQVREHNLTGQNIGCW